MALYKTHATFNIAVALPLLLCAIIRFYHPTPGQLGTFSLSFVYATLFMNPDLDLANTIKVWSLRGVLTLPFRGYSCLFKHRGLSHSLFFGTLTRILWLGALFYLVLFLIGRELPDRSTVMALLKTPRFLFGLAGIALADGCHLLLDIKL